MDATLTAHEKMTEDVRMEVDETTGAEPKRTAAGQGVS